MTMSGSRGPPRGLFSQDGHWPIRDNASLPLTSWAHGVSNECVTRSERARWPMPCQNSGSQSAAGTRGPRRGGREGRTGLERGLDGGGDELRGLRVDDDVPAEQHAADDLRGRSEERRVGKE